MFLKGLTPTDSFLEQMGQAGHPRSTNTFFGNMACFVVFFFSFSDCTLFTSHHCFQFYRQHESIGYFCVFFLPCQLRLCYFIVIKKISYVSSAFSVRFVMGVPHFPPSLSTNCAACHCFCLTMWRHHTNLCTSSSTAMTSSIPQAMDLAWPTLPTSKVKSSFGLLGRFYFHFFFCQYMYLYSATYNRIVIWRHLFVCFVVHNHFLKNVLIFFFRMFCLQHER
jgi:hypothetical protein